MNILRKLWAGWKAFGAALGKVQTAILLTVIYHVAIGPLALFCRLTRKETLVLRQPPDGSCATDLPTVSRTMEQAHRQF